MVLARTTKQCITACAAIGQIVADARGDDIIAKAREQHVVQRAAIHGIVARRAHGHVTGRASAGADGHFAGMAGVEIADSDCPCPGIPGFVTHDQQAVVDTRSRQGGMRGAAGIDGELQADGRTQHIEALAVDRTAILPERNETVFRPGDRINTRRHDTHGGPRRDARCQNQLGRGGDAIEDHRLQRLVSRAFGPKDTEAAVLLGNDLALLDSGPEGEMCRPAKVVGGLTHHIFDQKATVGGKIGRKADHADGQISRVCHVANDQFTVMQRGKRGIASTAHGLHCLRSGIDEVSVDIIGTRTIAVQKPRFRFRPAAEGCGA